MSKEAPWAARLWWSRVSYGFAHPDHERRSTCVDPCPEPKALSAYSPTLHTKALERS